MTQSVHWVVVGAAGQLGSDLMRVLDGAVSGVVGLTRSDGNLIDPAVTSRLIGEAVAAGERAGAARVVVLNAAAYTRVDDAESHEAEAFAGNALLPARLAAACASHGATLVHVSTDYVFAGDATEPYAEDTPPAPRSAYGRSKLAGEWAVLSSACRAFVVRTAWVYGQTGGNFAKTMAKLAAERDALSVVDDQRGSPTWSRDLAAGLVALGSSAADPGIYHATNGGAGSWFDFARAVIGGVGLDAGKVSPTTTDAFPRPAARPAYSVLSGAKWRAAGLPPLRDWREALDAALPVIFPAG